MNKMTRIEFELIPDIKAYFFVEKGMRSSKLNTCNFKMLMNQANLLCIWMKIIYMIGQWVNIYHIVDLNG